MKSITQIALMTLFALFLLLPSQLLGEETKPQDLLPSQLLGEETKPQDIFVSPDGKIYVKSKTPIYLHLSTSPDADAETHILRNQESLDAGEAPGSLHLEGHGRHSLVHPPDHKNIQNRKGEHLFHIHDDGMAPKTKVKVTKAPFFKKGNLNIYGKPVDISLKFSDEYSGVFAGYYSLDGSDFSIYGQSLKLDMEKVYILKYYAIDNVSNKSKTYTRPYSLDFTPPESSLAVRGKNMLLGGETILAPSAKLVLKSRDSNAGVKNIYKQMTGRKMVYKGALTMKGLSDGVHDLSYWAVDNVLNTESRRMFSFYLDRLPPHTVYTILGDKYRKGKSIYVSARSTIDLTATDNKAGVKRIRYYLNSKRGKIYSGPFHFPARNGKAKFSYAARDKVDNVSKRVYQSVIVDVSPPKVKPAFKGRHYFSRRTHYVRKSTRISLPATDNLSGIKSIAYSLDSGTDIRYRNSFSIAEEGKHSLTYHAIDNVNNNSNKKTITIYVDEKSPEIYTHFSVDSTVAGDHIYPPKSSLYLAATDEQAGVKTIYYRLNKGKEKVYKKPIFFTRKKSNKVKIRAVDNVGNESTSEVAFMIQ